MSSFLKVIDRGVQALLYAKFKDILGLVDFNADTVFYPKEIAFRNIAEKRGRAVVEFINVWRESSSFDWSRQRSAVARQDILLNYVDPVGKETMTTARAIPLNLAYNAWFWTKDYDKYNQIAELYSWWQHENPNLSINYNDVYPLEMDMHFGEAEDESTVPTMYDTGTYFVLKAPIMIDAWIMKSYDVKTIQKIIISIYDETVEANPQLLETMTLLLNESS